jgi:HemY protein
MALRGLLWLALLFVLAVVLATVGHFDAGQVLIVYPPYRIDVSLNLVVVGIVALFIVLYALIRIARNVWTMPQRVARYRTRAKEARAHASLREAIGNLYAGRFSRAEKAAREALSLESN